MSRVSGAGDVLTTLTKRASALEARIRSSGVFLMAPLPASAICQISMRAVERLRTMTFGSHTDLLVEIENGSIETLASLDPHPVNLAYHWLDPISGEMVVFEGQRTALTRNVLPSCIHRQKVRISSPPGRLVLRLTAVQEAVCWFETKNAGASVDIVVDVIVSGSERAETAAQSREFHLQRADAMDIGSHRGS